MNLDIDIFKRIDDIISNSKQKPCDNQIICYINKNISNQANVDLNQKQNLSFFEILNNILEYLGIDKLSEIEIKELLSIDIFNDINIPKKYYDIFLLIKIFGFRLIKRIIKYRRERNNDNINFWQNGSWQDNIIKNDS